MSRSDQGHFMGSYARDGQNKPSMSESTPELSDKSDEAESWCEEKLES